MVRLCRRRGRFSVVCALALAIVALPSVASAAGSGARPAGTRLWARLYRGLVSYSQDAAAAVALSPDGSTVFVTGSSGASPSSDAATVAYDAASGVRRWVSRYNGPVGQGGAAAIAVSPDGTTVFVAGWSSPSFGASDYLTVAYDAATGAEFWNRLYADSSGRSSAASAATVSADGSTVFVTGNTATVAYDASTGMRLWATGHVSLRKVSAGIGPDGATLFITGGTTCDYVTIAYRAATGERLWSRRYAGPSGCGFSTALGVSPDGSAVFVTGSSLAAAGVGTNYATLSYAARDGATLWVRRYNGPGNGDDDAVALALSPNGDTLLVTGTSLGAGNVPSRDFATVAYRASSGTLRWVRRYAFAHRGGGATAIGVSPDGSSVFVTGFSIGSTGTADYATAAYVVTTGAQRWIRRYDGPAHGDDDPAAVAVSPSGSSVFVTGRTTGTSGLDYATVAYSA